MSFNISEDEKRLADAVEDAEINFWGTIADLYPEAKHGDYPPDAAIHISTELTKAVKMWLEWNADPQIESIKETTVLLHTVKYFYNDPDQTLTDNDRQKIVEAINLEINEGSFYTPVHTRDDKVEVCGKWRIDI